MLGSKTFRVIIIIMFFVTLVVFAFIYFSNLNNNQVTLPIEDAKTTMIRKLNEEAATAPKISDTEKQKILQDLDQSAVKAKPLTDAEKLKILKSLH